jgi:hypothetical protein
MTIDSRFVTIEHVASNIIDACKSNILFCVWSDDNPMSATRTDALLSVVKHARVPVAFLQYNDIHDWCFAQHPFHPAYEYLSSTHKVDYLRCYLMHHYGGGYTDIKFTHANWKPYFDQLNKSNKWAMGYQEVGPNGVASVGGDLENVLKTNYQKLIGCCAFIFKRNTPLTTEWITRVHSLLDSKMEMLQRHPGKFPQDQTGIQLSNGVYSQYPLAWTEMLGNIFHPLVYKHSDQILQADIAPDFNNYR